MSDLIDRDETIKQFCKQDCGCDPKDCPDKTCYEVEIIESVPTHPTPSNTLGALDCVERQAVKDWLERWEGYLDEDMILRMQVKVGDIPSILPEGIRCKDCKHWMMGKTTKNYPNPYICELHSFMHGFERSALPEDYCSWAELR